MNRLFALGLLLFVVGCGSDSPTTPSTPTPPPPANVAGNWSGTFQGSQPITGPFIAAILMNLTQAGSSVSGTWAISNASGTVSGTTTTNSFSGTFTWNTTANNGTPCTGTMAMSGNAGGNTISWTSPAVTASCTNLPTGITIAAQLR